MKKSSFLLTVIFLTSCTSKMNQANAQVLPTSTKQSEIVLSTVYPTSTDSKPSSPVCDPRLTDFCIIDGHFILQNPIIPPGNMYVDITYRYGSTQENKREPHHGVELLNAYGTPVHAAADGVVQFAGPDEEAVYSPWKNFYGNIIVLRHEAGIYTLYAHLSQIDVQVGDEIKAGTLIGSVGQTGVAIGSHLHFEIRSGGDGTDYFSTQNPELWLIPNRGNDGLPYGAIEFTIEDGNGQPVFAEFTARYYQDKAGTKIKSHYVVTYAKDMMLLEENAALGGVPQGYYLVSLEFHGQLLERWVEVESGKLTQVVFVVK